MSGVLNDCDALLQGAAVRIVNPKNADIILTPDAQGFHVNSSGVANVSAITVTAVLYELDGPLSFSVQGASLSSVTDRTATVTYASMTGATAILTATLESGGVTYSQSCIIAVTQDGASGASAKVLTLSATEHVFKISKAGGNTPASITLTASGQNVVGTPSFTIPIGTATLTAGANASQKVLTYANMTSDSVTVQIALDGLTDRVTIIKVREGADGTPGADAINSVLTNESVTLPASSNGTVSSYSGAVCSMKVFNGVADDTANWTFAYSPASSSSSLTYTGSGGTVSVVTMAAGVDSAYVDITASRSGFVSITKRFSVAKSKAGGDGARGPGTYYATGTTWTDGAADAATPGANVTNDVVTISNGTTFAMTKKWDGSAWVAMGAVYDGSLFVTGSINGAALKAGTVEIRDTAGNLILGAGAALAQQTRVSPNLAPDLKSWKYAVGPASVGTGSPNTGNGEYINIASGTVGAGMYTDIFVPAAGGTFTLSCLANALVSGGDFVVDIIGNPGIDTTGLIGTPPVGVQQRYTTTFTLPANTSALQIRCYTPSGKGVQVCDIKLEQGSNATAWSSNVITAQNASTFIQAGAFGTLSAYAAFIGSMEIGAGGNIRQGMTDYGVGVGMWFGQHQGVNKFVIGDPNSSMMWWDGTQLQTKGLRAQSDLGVSMSILNVLNQPNGVYSYFDKGCNITGTSSGPFQYRYVLQLVEGDIVILGDPTAAVVRLRARGNNSTCLGYLTVTVNDEKGAQATATARVQFQFGSGALY